MSQAFDRLLGLLDLEQIEVNISAVQRDQRRQRVFGGQVAGQALVAAGRTVPADRPVHCLGAYLVRPAIQPCLSCTRSMGCRGRQPSPPVGLGDPARQDHLSLPRPSTVWSGTRARRLTDSPGAAAWPTARFHRRGRAVVSSCKRA